ncbi:hypothetical protein MNV49_005672 [Pseudohyphozyma bogoriensis]|nr:hypothetical protein MNV49_005672 [Pseudohyphozyma bogoriensis]
MEPQYVRELSTVYPHPVWRPVTALLYIASLVILSSMITRRMPTWREWREKRVTLVKAAVVLLLVVSLLFVGTAMLLVHGVGLSSSIEACTAAGWTSILLYEPSKGIIVFFLIERVHIITAHGTAMRRRDSKMYIFNITLLAACVSTLILACVYFRAEIRESDYTCVYHNNPKILAWGIAQDLGVNLWLTCLFAYPLYRGQSRSRKVKALAIKSIVVCFMMMLFVFANLMVFLLSNGREVGWVLLAAFSLDIMANAIGLFIVCQVSF